MYEIIRKKRDGGTLSEEEICFFIRGVTDESIKDYQSTALLMAIFLRGMTPQETATLTDAMAHSGDMVDLSAIPGVKVDKHSTGGVGDKTSLVIGPIVAACGVPVAKMSGRGLGHTGGTLDKLESIPGLTVEIEREHFCRIVRDVGLAIIGQTGNIAPADKTLYALRDVTATVDSLPLIASSIMSKKLASGADAILLDVKTGSGAFMKTLEDSIALAQAMVEIGEHTGRHTMALITDMDRPLGFAVGNSLEVIEAVETLRGHGPADLTEICLQLASNMLVLAGKGALEQCRALAENALASGDAFEKLCAMARAQGGDSSVLEDTSRFPKAPFTHAVLCPTDGFITGMQTEEIGRASVILGAGREKKGDAIDYSAGILLRKKKGDAVKCGDVLAELHTSVQGALRAAEEKLLAAIAIAPQQPPEEQLVFARVTKDSVERAGTPPPASH